MRYVDGLNLRQAYLGNPIIRRDPLGLFSVGEMNVSTGLQTMIWKRIGSRSSHPSLGMIPNNT